MLYLVLILVIIWLCYLSFWKQKKQIKEYEQDLDRYSEIQNIETEITNLKENQKKELQEIEKNKQKTIDEEFKIRESIDMLKNQKASLENDLEGLKKAINLYNDDISVMEFGIYKPKNQFDRSEQYKYEQTKIIDKQKAIVLDDKAIFYPDNWTINGSLSEGKKATKKQSKLALRAFNGECDALISNVKWNNVEQSKVKIDKSFETINKLCESYGVRISLQYKDLKTQQLTLEYEYQLKKQEEKEEARAIAEEIREEEKAKREIEQAQRDAQKEEDMYQKALDKARQEMDQATGEKQQKLLSQISELENKLLEAQTKKERALSMAQQTKRGHVYIISNIGSFGEDVYKIGMTRRLEPTDRVKELSSASVPFQFDVHSIIYSENAPALESDLHKHFAKQKLNLVNQRKEFFKVKIDDIEIKLKDMGISADFVREPEAQQYKETLVMLETGEFVVIDDNMADDE
jgi:Domain of unknown function (DUF4041)/Meiotically up-regulated gene 113